MKKAHIILIDDQIDVLSALLVYLGLNQLALSTAGFARVNLVLAGIWLAIAVAIGLEYRRRVRE